MAIGPRVVVTVLSYIALLSLVAANDSVIQECVKNLRHRSKGTSTEFANHWCKIKAEWQHEAALGKRHGFQPSAFGVTQAQIDFIDSLSDKADFTKSMSIAPGDLKDWPYRPPGAKARKEYRMMTDEERHRFHDAVNVLKNFYIDDTHNVYDTFVEFHHPSISPSAHFGPNFIVWHREYLHRLERALQLVDPDVTIPYWDTRMDEVLGDDAMYSMMWTEDFMGNKRGDVVTGPFKNWVLSRPVENRTRLFRGDTELAPVFGDYEYDYTVAIDNFRNLTLFVDPFFEEYHGNNHIWVNGIMLHLVVSPSDPAFFLHHSFMDKVWHDQQARVFREIGRQHYFYPREDDVEAYGIGYPMDPFDPNSPNVTEPRDSYHFYDNPMWPFTDKKNYEGLSDIYWLYYYYDDPPTCNFASPSCGSTYLFCMPEISKCVPKLQPGANCANFKDHDSCYDGQCIDHRCVSAGKAQKHLFHPKKLTF